MNVWILAVVDPDRLMQWHRVGTADPWGAQIDDKLIGFVGCVGMKYSADYAQCTVFTGVSGDLLRMPVRNIHRPT